MSDEPAPDAAASAGQNDLEMAKAMMQQQFDLMLSGMQQVEAQMVEHIARLDARVQELRNRVGEIQRDKDQTGKDA
jgi:hypothetical protein